MAVNVLTMHGHINLKVTKLFFGINVTFFPFITFGIVTGLQSHLDNKQTGLETIRSVQRAPGALPQA